MKRWWKSQPNCILIAIGLLVVLFTISHLLVDTSLTDLGTFIVLALTLAVLIGYADDTHRIAKVTESMNSVERATYSMTVPEQPANKDGGTSFSLHNPTTLLLRAKVWCNFRVYGQPVEYDDDYNGVNTWYIYPQQSSRGWFAIRRLLERKGKKPEDMMSQKTEANKCEQLTMDLEIQFWDDQGNRKDLQTRRHHFDFTRWVWIPKLTKKDDWEE